MTDTDIPTRADLDLIKRIIPHRYPFLLVDKIVEFVPGKKAVGIKKVTANGVHCFASLLMQPF